MLITTKSAEAAQRPLAGSGIGAHLCDGLVAVALVGVSGSELGAPMGIETAAALALPRIRWAAAISGGATVPADASDAGYQVSIQAKTAQFIPQQYIPQQFSPRSSTHSSQGTAPHDPCQPGFPGWSGSASSEGTGTGLGQTGQILSQAADPKSGPRPSYV